MTQSPLQKQKMSSQGRGRGFRRNLEGNEKQPGGLKSRLTPESRVDPQRVSEESERVISNKTRDSPIPDTFSTADLIDIVDKIDVSKTDDKDHLRQVTRCIKHLCNSEESLRLVNPNFVIAPLVPCSKNSIIFQVSS